jgi:hypothetical protein
VITFADMLDQRGRPLTLEALQDDRLVSWISNKRYNAIQQAVQKLPKFAETVEKYGLTQEEGAAIYAYTTNLYDKINPKMRSGKLTKKDEGFISVVEQGLAKLPAFDGVTYRRIDLSKADLARYQVGSVVTENAFTSSSKKQGIKGFNGYVEFEIKGKNGKQIEKLSKYPQQYEVLFGEKTKFKVTNYKEDSKMKKVIIKLSEL